MINETPAVAETVEVVDNLDVAAEAVAAPVGLTIQDLAQLRNIINVASQRGAYKTEEFTVVGATYTKLNDFVNSVTAQAEEAPAVETAPEEVGKGE